MRRPPICAARVTWVPPHGDTSKSPMATTRTSAVTLGSRRSGSAASSPGSGHHARTTTSSSITALARSSAAASSRSGIASRVTSIVQSRSPRRADTVGALAASISARDRRC